LGYRPTIRQLQWMVYFTTGQLAPRKFFETSPIKELLSHPYPPDAVTSAQLLDFQTYMRDAMLLKSDRSSMFNSLEVRVPYLDRDVIAYAFTRNQPFTSLLQTKLPLRRLLADKLPASIRNRPKKGFGLPLADWISGPLSNLIKSYVYRTAIRNIYPPKLVDSLFVQKRLRTLWTVFAFSFWQETWVKDRI